MKDPSSFLLKNVIKFLGQLSQGITVFGTEGPFHGKSEWHENSSVPAFFNSKFCFVPAIYFLNFGLAGLFQVVNFVPFHLFHIVNNSLKKYFHKCLCHCVWKWSLESQDKQKYKTQVSKKWKITPNEDRENRKIQNFKGKTCKKSRSAIFNMQTHKNKNHQEQKTSKNVFNCILNFKVHQKVEPVCPIIFVHHSITVKINPPLSFSLSLSLFQETWLH